MSRILILVLSCYKNKERLDSVLNTWYKTIKSPHIIKILGDDTLQEEYGKDIIWSCIKTKDEKYFNLTKKMLNAFRFAMELESWDYLYKCDDDTYLNIDNLEWFLSKKDSSLPLYIGRKIINPFPYAQGGSGYVITRPTLFNSWVKLEENLLKSKSEDRTFGKTMLQVPIYLEDSSLFNSFNPVINGKNKIMRYRDVSVHPIIPKCMYEIYSELNIKPY